MLCLQLLLVRYDGLVSGLVTYAFGAASLNPILKEILAAAGAHRMWSLGVCRAFNQMWCCGCCFRGWHWWACHDPFYQLIAEDYAGPLCWLADYSSHCVRWAVAIRAFMASIILCCVSAIYEDKNYKEISAYCWLACFEALLAPTCAVLDKVVTC